MRTPKAMRASRATQIAVAAFALLLPLGLALRARPVDAAGAFTLTSPAFKNNGMIPEKYSFNQMNCTGENLSPPLAWANPPTGTKSFALMVHDPDAPTGSGWWHWVVYDIPADVAALPEGAGKEGGGALLPKGAALGHTDFGTAAYGGPCPPPGSGKHHYHFTLFALKVDKLEVPASASSAMIGFNVNANSLGKASLTGLFVRK